jgi:hypothetical protein
MPEKMIGELYKRGRPEMDRKTVKKWIVLAVCALLIAGSFFSAAFVCTHIDHEHDHDGPGGSCAACIRLAASENLLKLLSVALFGAALGAGSLFAVFAPLKLSGLQIDSFTLVRLKIRLNN